MLGPVDLALAGTGALAAGMVNALAGGGTLITFPTLVALGVPVVEANVTNTVALCPGYFGATLAQKKDLVGQQPRMMLLLPASVIGGIVGGVLLLNTSERLFRILVPFLILLASILLAAQDRMRNWLARRASTSDRPHHSERLAILPIFGAAVYGGYFGAGLSVIVLAVLGVLLEDTLTRLNALKQFVAFAVNVAAAMFLVFSGKVLWLVAVIMMVGALLGGIVGGRLAGRIKPATLRWIVVSIGFVVAAVYFARL